MLNQFAADVAQGLGAPKKTLSSKYFYDAIGDDLFTQIMALPEYYLTRAEMEIFTQQTNDLITALGQEKSRYFELIEMGAGDGQKTIHLLRGLLKAGYDFTYVPIDISENVLKQLEGTLHAALPDLKVRCEVGDYFECLSAIHQRQVPSAVLYLGSNLGNFDLVESKNLMKKLSQLLMVGDRLVLGVDRIKSADIVLPAYNDNAGVTKAFNLNLLTRINTELGGNFELSRFAHRPEYDETTGLAQSFLVSLEAQTIYIEALDTQYEFSKGEKIQTEISRKYDLEKIADIIEDTPFEITIVLKDSQDYFFDIILTRA